ncbi:MAG: FAD-dependent oxidoreductase [Rhodocyclaceae bacterium]|nr:FAD-dependent oxidoreductase [Rhodocyclaceae bacterium]MBX3668340.1 FAD-dependent oxidoreductase [Rhodocyclaceae bacterium]
MASRQHGRHHVIIGSGVAGNQAAETLRARDPDSRVTMITLSKLPFFNRYDLPRVFHGERDWRKFVIYPAEYFLDQRIALRRATRVTGVDGARRTLALGHNETVRFDTLLVASGASPYMPAELMEYRPLMHGFVSFQEAVAAADALPRGGHAMLMGGDTIGLDLGRTLLETGYRVSIAADKHLFWPHEVPADLRPRYLDALRSMGFEVIDAEQRGQMSAVRAGGAGQPARLLVFNDGSEIAADIVMPFFGIAPSIEYMLGSGADIERGLLVKPNLRTTNEAIYAAGDVCQIWNDADKRYRFYHGWKNVRAMGELAARNLTGADQAWLPSQDENLQLSAQGGIHSPFWEYA